MTVLSLDRIDLTFTLRHQLELPLLRTLRLNSARGSTPSTVTRFARGGGTSLQTWSMPAQGPGPFCGLTSLAPNLHRVELNSHQGIDPGADWAGLATVRELRLVFPSSDFPATVLRRLPSALKVLELTGTPVAEEVARAIVGLMAEEECTSLSALEVVRLSKSAVEGGEDNVGAVMVAAAVEARGARVDWFEQA